MGISGIIGHPFYNKIKLGIAKSTNNANQRLRDSFDHSSLQYFCVRFRNGLEMIDSQYRLLDYNQSILKPNTYLSVPSNKYITWHGYTDQAMRYIHIKESFTCSYRSSKSILGDSTSLFHSWPAF